MSVLLLLILYYVNVIVCDSDKISPAIIDAYCKLKCDKDYGKEVKHTVCEHRCEILPECLEFKNHKMSDKDRQFILDLHNYYKNLIGSGRDTRGGNGRAKNMLALNYDVDIEVPTLCWAKRCEFEHDKCRQSLKHADAGQNLYVMGFSGKIEPHELKYHLNNSAFSWYEEMVDTTASDIKKYGYSTKKIGHYTQMVWARTKVLGCSKVSYNIKNSYRVFVICNYSPQGNIQGMPVYEFGKGCSGDLKPNSEYTSLCGEIKILSSDRDPAVSSVGKMLLDGFLLVFPLIMYCTV